MNVRRRIWAWFSFALSGLTLGGAMAGCPKPEAAPPVKEVSRLSIVRERAGSARVEGVGPIKGFASGRDCTFIHCLELVLEATGRKVSYDELMGLSGVAFRTQFRTDAWDVGNPDPLVGDNRLPILFEAIGWDFELRVVKRDEYHEVEDLYRTIFKSIDAGIPVLAANIIPPEDWGIITGYRLERTLLCRAYNGGAEQVDKQATGWPTAVVLLTNRKVRTPVRTARVESIKRAVELFDKPAVGAYAQGARAFDEWMQDLRTPKDRNYLHANFWAYVSLIDARGAAVRFLKTVSRDMPGQEMHIGMAADWYDNEVRLLMDGLVNVPAENAYPTSMPPAETRNRQIETLKQAKALEEKAIAALRKTL